MQIDFTAPKLRKLKSKKYKYNRRPKRFSAWDSVKAPSPEDLVNALMGTGVNHG